METVQGPNILTEAQQDALYLVHLKRFLYFCKVIAPELTYTKDDGKELIEMKKRTYPNIAAAAQLLEDDNYITKYFITNEATEQTYITQIRSSEYLNYCQLDYKNAIGVEKLPCKHRLCETCLMGVRMITFSCPICEKSLGMTKTELGNIDITFEKLKEIYLDTDLKGIIKKQFEYATNIHNFVHKYNMLGSRKYLEENK